MNFIPTISIIVPCFNYGHFIRNTIASVEKCDSSLYELIIVDDGSTDLYTQKVLKELKEEGYNVIFQKNQGVAAARNTGIKASRGKYILPLDSDDEIYSSYLTLAINILDKSPDVGVVYARAEFFGAQQGEWKLPTFDIRRLALYNYVYVSGIYRKKLWIDCEGYDTNPQIDGWEDWDFWLSIAKKNWNFVQLNEILFRYRIHDSSKMFNYRERNKVPERVEKYMFSKHYDLYKDILSKMYDDVLLIEHWRRNPLRGAAKLLCSKYAKS